MNVRVYELDLVDDWIPLKEFDEKVISVTSSNGNYIVILEREDYFGKLVFLYDMSRHKIEIVPCK